MIYIDISNFVSKYTLGTRFGYESFLKVEGFRREIYFARKFPDKQSFTRVRIMLNNINFEFGI